MPDIVTVPSFTSAPAIVEFASDSVAPGATAVAAPSVELVAVLPVACSVSVPVPPTVTELIASAVGRTTAVLMFTVPLEKVGTATVGAIAAFTVVVPAVCVNAPAPVTAPSSTSVRWFVRVAPSETAAPVDSVASQFMRSSPASASTEPVLVKGIAENPFETSALTPAPVARSVPSFVNGRGVPVLNCVARLQLCPLAADMIHSPRFSTELVLIASVVVWLPDIVTVPSFTSAPAMVEFVSDSVAPEPTRSVPQSSVAFAIELFVPVRSSGVPELNPGQKLPPVIVSRPEIVPPSDTRSVPPVMRRTVLHERVATVRSPVVLV